MLMTGSGTVVIHSEQFHEKLVFEEASLVYSVAVTFAAFNVAPAETKPDRIESLDGY